MINSIRNQVFNLSS